MMLATLGLLLLICGASTWSVVGGTGYVVRPRSAGVSLPPRPAASPPLGDRSFARDNETRMSPTILGLNTCVKSRIWPRYERYVQRLPVATRRAANTVLILRNS